MHFPSSRNLLLACTMLMASLFACEKDQDLWTPDDKEVQYAFFVAGHSYGTPNDSSLGLHKPFKAWFNWINAYPKMEFGVLNGDIVRHGKVENWDAVDQDLALLEVPIYFAPGNHDMYNRELFETRYGRTWYHFFQDGDLFIVLDPYLDHWNISGEQWERVQELLADYASAFGNINVFVHPMLWHEEDNIYQNIFVNSFSGRGDSINFWSEVEPAFNQMPQEVRFFAGDFGATYQSSDYMYHHYDNISLIGTGMGENRGDNFLIVEVMKDKSVRYKLIALDLKGEFEMGSLTEFVIP